jgi:hypothetical protein
MEVDKNNIFLEENDNNNFTAVPVTLTLQHPAGTPQLPLISSDNSNNLCSGQSLTLTATAGLSYLWNTGETTQSIVVSTPGSYTCTVTNYCGTNTSDPFLVNSVIPDAPQVTGDTICVSGEAVLTATGTGELYWYDGQNNFLGTGNTFVTPTINANTTYYVQNTDIYTDSVFAEPHSTGIGGGGYVTSDKYEIFSSYVPFTLQSVLVNSQGNGPITIELQDETGQMLETLTTNVPSGTSRIETNFSVPVASNLRLVGKSLGVGLYRNNNSATYPYELPGILSITGASAGASYYYFFYDWEVHTENSSCSSDMVPVQAVVSSCASLGENVPFRQSIKLSPNPNQGQYSVQFNTPNTGEMDVELVSIQGQTILRKTIEHKNGLNSLGFNHANISSGIYLFNLVYEGKTYTQRLIIE